MADALATARAAYTAHAWRQAFDAYAAVDSGRRHEGHVDDAVLDADDLNRFAISAAMLDRYDDYFAIREREYGRRLHQGDARGALRTAVWLGVQKLISGQVGAGTGWLARAARHLEDIPGESAELGWVLMARAIRQARRDVDGAVALADDAVRLARQFGDPDLAALTLQGAGVALIAAGRVASGLELLDEAMVAVAAEETSPMVVGIVYCSVLSGCWNANELRRAQEWTAAMTAWCASQPEMANFTRECTVHRAELKQLHGAWHEAYAELANVSWTRADPLQAGSAAYVRGDLHRLLGRHDAAEQAFREAAQLGVEPQPGLALLRLAGGSTQAAAAMVRRALGERWQLSRRVQLLAAACEVFLAADEVAAASSAADELAAAAQQQGSPVTAALAAQARAAVDCHGGRVADAVGWLRSALSTWRRLPAPYQEARVRELLATACRAVGDDESARRELADARALYARLGAVTDLRRIDGEPRADGLTAREREVLRLLATGSTNRAIADRLVLSERTVDRHVSNILAKLRVPSRSAAVAVAVDRDLV